MVRCCIFHSGSTTRGTVARFSHQDGLVACHRTKPRACSTSDWVDAFPASDRRQDPVATLLSP